MCEEIFRREKVEHSTPSIFRGLGQQAPLIQKSQTLTSAHQSEKNLKVSSLKPKFG